MTETCSLNIRKIERTVRDKLRLRAAQHGCSLEEEARNILRQAARNDALESETVADSFRQLFGPQGGADLELPDRTASRSPPDFSGPEYGFYEDEK